MGWNGAAGQLPHRLLPFAGVLLLAGLVRFWGLGVESLWLDEATSLVVAENQPAGIVALTAEDIHPPLYYLLLHLWLAFGRSEAAIRSLSAVVGVASVAALYGLGRELWGERAGVLSALLLAVSPLHVWYSQEARMYALVTFWAILSCGLMALAWRRGTWPLWIGYALAVARGMYTHYYMGFVVLAQNLFVGYLLLRRRAGRPALLRWGLAQAAWLALFAPWLPTVLGQVRGGGGAWVAEVVGRPGARALWDTFIAFSIGPVRELYPAWLRRGAYLLYLALPAVGLWAGLHSESSLGARRAHPWPPAERAAFVLLWCAAPIAVAWLASQVRPMYSLRYLLPFLPPFCLLLAAGLAWVMGKWRGLGYALAAALVLLGLSGTWLMAGAIQKPDWRGLAAYLIQESEEGDVVALEPFWNAKPLRYYAAGRLTISDAAPLPATRQGVAEAVAQLAARARRLWLVEDVGHYGDPERLLAGHLNARYPLLHAREYPGIGRVALYVLEEAR